MYMKQLTHLTALLLAALFLCSLPLHAQKDQAEPEVLSVLKPSVQQTVSILQDASLSRSEKKTRIEQIADDLFNYELMGKLVLGKRHWSALDNDQNDRYVRLLKRTLKRSYFQKMEEVSGVRIVYDEPVQKGPNKVYVPTTVQFQDEDLNVEYRLFRPSEDRPWKVFDVVVKGVSIVKSYRSQYSDYLQDHSVNELLTRMEDKLDELEAQDGDEE